MKGLMIFTALVLGYATFNMFQSKVDASTYKQGIAAYMKHQVDYSNVSRRPAIELKRVVNE